MYTGTQSSLWKRKRNWKSRGDQPSVLGLHLGVHGLDGALKLPDLFSHLVNLLVSHVDTENDNESF